MIAAQRVAMDTIHTQLLAIHGAAPDHQAHPPSVGNDLNKHSHQTNQSSSVFTFVPSPKMSPFFGGEGGTMHPTLLTYKTQSE